MWNPFKRSNKTAELKSSISAYQRQCEELKSAVEEQQQTIDTLNCDCDSLKAENKRLLDENTALKKEAERHIEPPIERPATCEPITESLLVQDEYDSFVDKIANATSELLLYCSSLTTMDLTSSECIQYIESEIKQSVAGCGIEITEEADSDFDPERHRCIETKVCETPEQLNHISEVVAPGFWYKNRCLIPQAVVVYKNQD